MKAKTVWKVVRQDNGKLLSAVVEEPIAIEYKPGNWVSAKTGFLFAFRAVELAAEFARNGCGLEIWEAKAQGVWTTERVISAEAVRRIPLRWLADWWDGKWVTKRYEDKPFPGTVVCERIKLIRRIWKWNSSTDTWTNGRSVTTPELSKQ